jgi:ribonuclease HI
MHFLCISDPGPISTPPNLLFPGYKLIQNQLGPNPSRKTAILVHESIVTGNDPLRDPSGGLLALDIRIQARPKPTSIRVIAIYQPPNADQLFNGKYAAPMFPHHDCAFKGKEQSNKPSVETQREESNRMRLVLKNWTINCPRAIAAGDFNETIPTASGRLSRNKTTLKAHWKEGTHRGPLYQLIQQDQWGSDLYQTLHAPLPHAAPTIPADSKKHGHNHWDAINNSGTARLNYVIVKGDLNTANGEYKTLYNVPKLPITSLNDHVPVIFKLPIIPCRRHQQNVPAMTMTSTAHLTPEQILKLHFKINSAAPKKKLQSWIEALTNLNDSTPQLEKVFENIANEISEHLQQVGHSYCPRPHKRQHPKSRPRQTRAQRRAYQDYHALTSLRNALTDAIHERDRQDRSTPAAVYSKQAALALRTLARKNSLLLNFGDMRYIPLTQSSRWRRWLEIHYDCADKAARAAIACADKENPDHPKQQRKRLFQTSKGRGKLIKQILSTAVPTPLDRATDEDGEVQFNPEVYKPIIAKEAAKPFSNPKTGPAVPLWRPLTDEERNTGYPRWWKRFYARNAKNLPETIWKGLMSQTTPAELRAVVSQAKHGVSPGHDGITMDFLKILTGAHPNILKSVTRPAPEYTALIVALVNAALTTRHCPRCFKLGVIVLLPKPGKDSSIIGNRRPITLLPELGKLTNRILALRFQLCADSAEVEVFENANRAYSQEGSFKQALRVFTDTTIHWNASKGPPPKRSEALNLILYDLAKAFDSVQKFSIKAACERYNLPPAFIELMLNMLTEADSSVRTSAGNTRAFRLRTSVRQGDPMAALLFNMIMDALHYGFSHNPLYPDTKGYTFRSGKGNQLEPTEIHSIGFADDTACPTPNWQATTRAHAWMLDFCVAHHLRLNASKTVVVVDEPYTPSFTGKNKPPNFDGLFLPNIEEHRIIYSDACKQQQQSDCPPPPDRTNNQPPHETPEPAGANQGEGPTDTKEQMPQERNQPLQNRDILTYPPSHTFRYLGLETSLLGPGTKMRNTVQGRIFAFTSKIRYHHVPPLAAIALTREILYPRLELGLEFTPLPQAQLRKWDAIIRSSVLRADTGSAIEGLSKPLFHLACGIPPLRNYRLLAQTVLYCNPLRGAAHAPSTHTTYHNLMRAIKTKRITTEAPPVDLSRPLQSHFKLAARSNQVTKTGDFLPAVIHELNLLNISLTWYDPAPPPTPNHPLINPWPWLFLAPYNCNIQSHARSSGYDPALSKSYCKPLNDPDSPLAVFTDGSFRAPKGSKIKRGGYAAILTLASNLDDPNFTFQDERIAILSGGSPGAGQSYSAEHLAILATLQALPVNTPIKFYTDCLAALLVLAPALTGTLANRYTPTAKALRRGARPIVNTSERLLQIRDRYTTTDFQHVKAHTGNKDIQSQGNAVADRHANAAAEDPDNIGEQTTPFITNESRFIFWTQLKPNQAHTHVIGNIRPAIKKQQENALLAELRKQPKQGAVARAVGPALVRRFTRLRQQRNHGLFMFLLRASAQLLPTPEAAHRAADQRSRDNLLCKACRLHRVASSRHALNCPATIKLQLALHAQVEELLKRLVAPVLCCPHVTPEEKATIATLPKDLHWYKPYHPHNDRARTPPHWSSRHRELYESIDKYDRYCGVLGFLPKQLALIAFPESFWDNTPEHALNTVRLHIEDTLQSIQDTLTLAAYKTFTDWKKKADHPSRIHCAR